MTVSEIIQGDCVDVLRGMDADSVHCVVTSPPYWGLRDYGVEDAIGLESTLDEYVSKMVEVFREVRRVLRPDGCLWLNLGDTYAGGGRGGNPEGSVHKKQETNVGSVLVSSTIPPGLKPKDLCGVPWRVAFALQADGWWLRSDVIWAKPNPMPESVTDRPTKAHEYVFLLTKSARYFYDAEAVKIKEADTSRSRLSQATLEMQAGSSRARAGGKTNGPMKAVGCVGGANLRTVWNIPTQSYKGAHFATYPQKLVERCLKAGTSAKGCCPACGTPWRRVVEKERVRTRPGYDSKSYDRTTGAITDDGMEKPWRDRAEIGNRDPGRHVTEARTIGWKPGCECGGEPVPCRVLDPFVGAGTTGVVAKLMGLDFVGIELNPKYCDMARKRIANPNPELDVPDVPGQLELFE